MLTYKHLPIFYRKYLAPFLLIRLIKELILISWRGAYIAKCSLSPHPISGIYRWRSLSNSTALCSSLVNFASREEIHIPAPFFFGSSSEQALARTPRLNIVYPEIKIYEFPEAVVIGGIDFIFHAEYVIHHELFIPSQHHCPAENLGVISSKRDGDRIKLSLSHTQLETNEAISLIGQCSGNYAHWLTETLPKLAIINKIEHLSNAPLLIEKGLHKNILSSINLLNPHARKLIEVPRWTPIRATKIITVSSPGYERYVPQGVISREPAPYINNFSPTALRELRTATLDAIKDNSIENPKGIYFCRSSRSSNLRQIKNIQRLEKIILAYGLHIAQTDAMSFKEQVQACSQAKIIVAPIGAALANMIFAPKGCKVVALAPYYEEASYFYYSNLAGALGHRIYFVLGKQLCKSRHPMHRNYIVEEGALLQALDEAHAE